MKQKSDQNIALNVKILFSERYKCQNKRMLLSNLIHQHDFTSGISERVKNNSSGNDSEEEHVE